MILAVAGRRIDGEEAAEQRFPLHNVALVRGRVRALLQKHRAEVVVSSAACGADLIALTEARGLGLRVTIVLPFDRRDFRKSSVVDRPGKWGVFYDDVIEIAAAAGDLVELHESLNDDAYRVVNAVILDATVALMNDLRQPGGAVLIWEGSSKDTDDISQNFRHEAGRRGFPIFEVPTL